MTRRKPTQERAQATVQAILEATGELLVRDGYARTSTNAIARRAGVSVGSLYHYFDDKDAIIVALSQVVIGRKLEVLVQALQVTHELELEDGIRRLVHAMLAGPERVRPRNVGLAAYVLVQAVFGVVQDALSHRPERLQGDALAHELSELVVGFLRPDPVV